MLYQDKVFCLAAITTLLLLFPLMLIAQPANVEAGRTSVRLGIEAYKQNDYQNAIRHFETADSLRPNHYSIVYNLAAMYAKGGYADDALATLNRFADLGLAADFTQDSDFTNITSLPEFAGIAEKIAHNSSPTNNATLLSTLTDPQFIPEGIAYDPQTQSFFLGSIFKSKIDRIQDGKITTFVESRRHGLWSVFGMAVDPTRRWLWVCTSAMQQTRDVEPDSVGRAAVYKFDVDTGDIISRYELADRSTSHVWGDLTLGSDGTVYISDSIENVVYEISVSTDSLSRITEPGPFLSLQGITVDDRLARLYVADYTMGVFSIDLATKAITRLRESTEHTLLGIDGIYFFDGTLIAIQNGVRPHRILQLSGLSHNQIDEVKVLESNNPFFDEPTLGVVHRTDFFFVGNSQWGGTRQDGTLNAEYVFEPPHLLRLPLVK